jgi:hypothetical protein
METKVSYNGGVGMFSASMGSLGKPDMVGDTLNHNVVYHHFGRFDPEKHHKDLKCSNLW